MDLINGPIAFRSSPFWIKRATSGEVLRSRGFYGKTLRPGCLAQVDLLGFSSLLRNAAGRAIDVVLDAYQQTEVHARIGARTGGDDGTPTIALFQYADTINILAREEGPLGIEPVVRAVAYLLASLHGRGLAARAGITLDEVWVLSRSKRGGRDGDFVSGPAVARAHQVEGSQEWAGGILDPSCDLLIDSPEVERLRDEGWVVPARVPLKSTAPGERAEAMAVNWPRILHVPNPEWLASVLACDNPPEAKERRNWEKRRAAWDFYQEHGAGALHAHGDSYAAFLITPSGKHLPLYPGPTFDL